MTRKEKQKKITEELNALRICLRVLSGFDLDQRDRIINYIGEYYKDSVTHLTMETLNAATGESWSGK
jgi:hypothetical protein